MRNVHGHATEPHGFDETIRALVRSSPWWMISAVVHGVALLILWNITWVPNTTSAHPYIVASAPEIQEVPEIIEEPPPPVVPPESIEETPLDPVEEQPQTDVDQPFEEKAGEEGLDDAPFTGPSENCHIGVGGPPGGGRRGRGGHKDAGFGGGHGLTEISVELGLKWLADHQDVDTDGKWDCDDFAKHDAPDDKCDGPGGAQYDVGVTGLALLAFLGAGYTSRGDKLTNPYARNVRHGLRYLRSVQDDDGCFGTRASQHFMYNHAIAALAICEAYWMTRDPGLKKPAQDALNFIARSRNPYAAWRYEPRGGDNDTSVTGWMIMALKSGKFAGLEIDADAFEGARVWIEKMTDPDFGQVGYNMPGGTPARPEGLQDRFPPEKSQSMTAVGMLTRIFLGEDPRTSKSIRMGADLCAEHLPDWNPESGVIDMYYWYYATLALYQVGGTHWKQWNKAMTRAIVKHQHPRQSGSRTGSWDPIGPWGPDGGRVYSTACMVMCLEVYYRYDKVFGTRSK